MASCLHPLLPLLLIIPSLSTATDAVTNSTQVLEDGETLSSHNGCFALGFFSPGNSTFRYLGIWYAFSVQTVVWVANRRNPIPDSTGILTLTADGTLVLVHRATVAVWSSGTASTAAINPIVRLLDSGNLVVTDISGATTWQSFDHPTDTMLPEMKVGIDLRSGHGSSLTSWKSPDDPSPGDYTYEMDRGGTHELHLKANGSIRLRTGPWNGLGFNGVPRMSRYADMFDYIYNSSSEEVYYTFKTKKTGLMSRFYVTDSGLLQRKVWVEGTKTWSVLIDGPEEDCDMYGWCGANAVCDSDGSELCKCYVGYAPVEPEEWEAREYGRGCERREKVLCGVGEGFRVVKGLKLPDTSNATLIKGMMSMEDCRELCLRNCSCTAYAAADISRGDGAGTGCIVWAGELVDTRRYGFDGQDLLLRVAAWDAEEETAHGRKKTEVVVIAVVVPVGIVVTAAIGGGVIWKKSRKLKHKRGNMERSYGGKGAVWEDDVHVFDFSAIASMTENFASHNKIGEGGFGTVYKGLMGDGQEVAVKRLSQASGQGLDAFMNEVNLISRLQHRNLVCLLGCCTDGEERILVYEYMPNGSLNAYIFDKEKRTSLNWRKRFDIITGIARGLLYLHHDSRLKIIHRDLKAGNILLDKDLNPKISDFGTARMFGADQLEENTKRVIGTYGYMSPEYAMNGKFSVKSDVYSFGVLLLEIINGRKSRMLFEGDDDLSLVAVAWRLWLEGQAIELVDNALIPTYSMIEVMRCIQIGLLCVQECPADRPTMSTVVSMLSNGTAPLPHPRRPGFWLSRIVGPKDSQINPSQASGTTSDITLTTLEGR